MQFESEGPALVTNICITHLFYLESADIFRILINDELSHATTFTQTFNWFICSLRIYNFQLTNLHLLIGVIVKLTWID